MSWTELVIGSAVLGVVVTFVLSLRFVTRRTRAVVPAAVVTGGDSRWFEGQGRARFARRFDAIHRYAVASALTAIVVMIECLVVMIVAVASR